jgi:hypothetical protein
MVSVYYDKDNLYMGNKDIVVSDFKGYVSAYVQIMNAIRAHQDFTVVTTSRQIYTQIEKLKMYYPREFKQKQFSIREDFEEKYGQNIPEYVTDQDLTVDKAYLDADYSSGESFENTMLRKSFGNFFVGKTFPFQIMAELCANLSLDDVKDKERVVLRKIFQKRIREYADAATGNYEKFIINEFIQNFDSLKSDVALYLVIKYYPIDFKEDILGRDMSKCMEYFRVEGSFIELDTDVEISYKDKATVYLNATRIDYSKAMSYVSGNYEFELNIVLEKSKDLNDSVIDEIIKKFAPLFNKNPEERDRILILKAPVSLIKPEDTYTIQKWMDWSISNYLPYRFWLEMTGKYDSKADEYSSMYADWVFENYDSLINSYPDIMYKILPSLKDDFINNEHSLIVILDNFNYKYVSELCQYMTETGFNQIDRKPVLAMLPTETSISKRAFFTGEAYNNNQQSYDRLTKSWSEQLGISMKYIPNVGGLRNLASFDEKVIFLNYLRIDDMLHENQSDAAQTIDVRIRQELKALINIITSTLRKLGHDKDTDIYFISDHGSTKILTEQPNEIDPKFYKEKAEDSDYRFISVNDEDFDNTKNAIGSLCYALSKARYGTCSNYFISRKYNRFIRNDMIGYVHGGITPEESIVPLMHFAFDIAQCKDPEITLGNDLLRFAVNTKLNIMVKNFNEFNLDEVTLVIQNSNIKYEKPETVTVDAYGTCLIEIPNARITKALDKKSNEELTIKLSYVANSRKHNYTAKLSLPMKSVQSSGTDLSDLF